MTENLTLADYVELALKRREVDSGRRLAEIAAVEGHDISHSTLNRIRKGNYPREVTTQILRAIAHLAREPEEAVFAAAARERESSWGEFEAAFFEWDRTRERLDGLTVRYARLRGISVAQADEELHDMARQAISFRHGTGDWYPPWDPEVSKSDGPVTAHPRDTSSDVYPEFREKAERRRS